MSSSRLVPELALARGRSTFGDGGPETKDRPFETEDRGPSPPFLVMRTNSPDSGIRVPPGVRRGT